MMSPLNTPPRRLPRATLIVVSIVLLLPINARADGGNMVFVAEAGDETVPPAFIYGRFQPAVGWTETPHATPSLEAYVVHGLGSHVGVRNLEDGISFMVNDNAGLLKLGRRNFRGSASSKTARRSSSTTRTTSTC